VESNWVHSAMWPPIGLLCQPRVIMMMEKLVEWWLAGETEVLGENLPQCHFVHHKPHMPARTRTRAIAVGSQRLTAWAMARPLYIALPCFSRPCQIGEVQHTACTHIFVCVCVCVVVTERVMKISEDLRFPWTCWHVDNGGCWYVRTFRVIQFILNFHWILPQVSSNNETALRFISLTTESERFQISSYVGSNYMRLQKIVGRVVIGMKLQN
jgi:hypothetical protein